jgi:hypothetical protein
MVVFILFTRLYRCDTLSDVCRVERKSTVWNQLSGFPLVS